MEEKKIYGKRRVVKRIVKKAKETEKVRDNKDIVPTILGLTLLPGAGENEGTGENENLSRRNFFKKVGKLGCALGLGTVGLMLSSCKDDDDNDCECENVGSCQCNRVCLCNPQFF